MRLPFNELQKALYMRLTAEMGSVAVYSPVAPADAARPFVVVSDFSATDNSLKGKWVLECSYTVHVWVDVEESLQQVNMVMNQATVALTKALLPLENGFVEVYARPLNARVNPEVHETGLVQHGTISFVSHIVDRR